MTENTINDAQTIAGNSGALLAGRYRVVRQLGHGGMGSVWLAEDTQLDGKQFAIKMLPSILVSNKRAYRQLKDEALVAMQLVHSNIVQIRAFEENNGNPFLVMDYIDGQTLDDYLAEKGKLSEDEVIRVLRPIAAALDYAHVEGVVHRDVKPANVMIRKDGHPFVLDFGIAREIQETMTRVTGKLSSGTLLYMSPEQLNGESPRKEQDIYSFAAMAYECLKGAPPFVRGAIEDQIKNKIPDPLPNSPSVMAGLAKKPEDRPKNCESVLEVPQNTPSKIEGVAAKQPWEPDNNHKDLKGGGAWKTFLMVASIGLAAVGGWWYYRQQKHEDPRIAVEEEIQEVAAQKIELERKAAEERMVSEVATRKAAHEAIGRERCNNLRQKGRDADSKEVEGPKENEPKHLVLKRKTGDTKTITLPGRATMEMIYCAPGSFVMGSPETEDGHYSNEKQHRVTLTRGFWLGKYEVTQEQWQSVMGNNPSNFKGNRNPVDRVSWNDCQKFIAMVNARLNCGARLPTETEWEYACRAGTETAYHWGNTLNGDKANCDGNYPCGMSANGPYLKETTPVGQYGANPWGFYDMHGNVLEWCEDASGSYRALRGGCWGNYAQLCRSAARSYRSPTFSSSGNGFRLCCDKMPNE